MYTATSNAGVDAASSLRELDTIMSECVRTTTTKSCSVPGETMGTAHAAQEPVFRCDTVPHNRGDLVAQGRELPRNAPAKLRTATVKPTDEHKYYTSASERENTSCPT